MPPVNGRLLHRKKSVQLVVRFGPFAIRKICLSLICAVMLQL